MKELRYQLTDDWNVSALAEYGLTDDELEVLSEMTQEEIVLEYLGESRFKQAIVLIELFAHHEQDNARILAQELTFESVQYEMHDADVYQAIMSVYRLLMVPENHAQQYVQVGKSATAS